MSNDWFQFKRFIVRQQGAGMKVSTDGVLVGAWPEMPENGKTVLDIGTGAGLIALMIAQRFRRAAITAIEIDSQSARLAAQNFQESPWNSRIRLINTSFQDFVKDSQDQFSLIITNPPYFRNSLKTGNTSRNLARHQDSLSPEELFNGVRKLLEQPEGIFSLIIPYEQEEDILEIASESGMKPQRTLRIRPNPGKQYIRTLFEFGYSRSECLSEELSVELDQRHTYSKEYMELTRDFYLKF